VTAAGPSAYAGLGDGVAEAVDRHGAFPRLDEGQRALLRGLGCVREVEPGEILFRSGDESSDFFVIESGAVTIVQGLGEENRVIAVHGAHRSAT
jgi:thioredoxin reductase (NADPH)